MTRWVRPNPAREHNGGLMMWVRLMGGYHWQHCPLAGHRTLGTKYRLATEGVEGAGWLGRRIGHLPLPGDTCGGENTHTLLSVHTHTQINTCSVDTFAHLHTFRDLYLQTGRLVVELGQLRPPWLNFGSMEQTLCEWLCVFCGLITLWCSSFTLGVIDTPVRAEWTLTHGSKSTAPLWLAV